MTRGYTIAVVVGALALVGFLVVTRGNERALEAPPDVVPLAASRAARLLEPTLVVAANETVAAVAAAEGVVAAVVRGAEVYPGAGVPSAAGEVRVCGPSGREWETSAVIVPEIHEKKDLFGASLAVSAETLVLGLPHAGKVCVYARTDSGWMDAGVLESPAGVEADRFGESVAVSGERVLVGAPGYAPSDPGTAWIFERTGAGFALAASLVALDRSAGDEFGGAVAIDGETAVVGAPGDDTGDVTAHGSAYLFALRDGDWSFEEKLKPEEPTAFAGFGTAVSIHAGSLAVGAPRAHLAGSFSGAAFTYERRRGAWVLTRTLVPESGGHAYFGSALTVGPRGMLVGAPGVDAVHLFIDEGCVRCTARDPEEVLELGAAVAMTEDRLVVIGRRGSLYSCAIPAAVRLAQTR